MDILNGTITHYMGIAYTGDGIRHKYDDLIKEASKVYFLKAPPTTELSNALKEIGLHYVKRGYDIDCFADPLLLDTIDAVYVKDLSTLYLQASHPISLEPFNFGTTHKVIPFYDAFSDEKLREHGGLIREYLAKAEVSLEKALKALSEAKLIHDEWEVLNISRMNWDKHELITEEMTKELLGTLHLNKKSKSIHRLIGSLTAGGAKDFVPSITKGTRRRMMIKGLPGTGKSTMMKAIGKEAELRGLDVLYGWCGLDSRSVDMIVIPELRVSIFDSTPPHEYAPEFSTDEIVDIAQLCEVNDEVDAKIEDVSYAYSEKMLDAKGHLHSYGDYYNAVRKWVDSTVSDRIMKDKVNSLLLEV